MHVGTALFVCVVREKDAKTCVPVQTGNRGFVWPEMTGITKHMLHVFHASLVFSVCDFVYIKLVGQIRNTKEYDVLSMTTQMFSQTDLLYCVFTLFLKNRF